MAEDHEGFSFEVVKLKMPSRHPRGIWWGVTSLKYNHGVISVEMMFKAMRLKSPKKYV